MNSNAGTDVGSYFAIQRSEEYAQEGSCDDEAYSTITLTPSERLMMEIMTDARFEAEPDGGVTVRGYQGNLKNGVSCLGLQQGLSRLLDAIVRVDAERDKITIEGLKGVTCEKAAGALAGYLKLDNDEQGWWMIDNVKSFRKEIAEYKAQKERMIAARRKGEEERQRMQKE